MEVFSKPMNKIIRTLTKELPKIANSSTRYPNEHIYESEIDKKRKKDYEQKYINEIIIICII